MKVAIVLLMTMLVMRGLYPTPAIWAFQKDMLRQYYVGAWPDWMLSPEPSEKW